MSPLRHKDPKSPRLNAAMASWGGWCLDQLRHMKPTIKGEIYLSSGAGFLASTVGQGTVFFWLDAAWVNQQQGTVI